LGDLEADRRIFFEKYDMRVQTEFMWLRAGTRAGFYELGNEVDILGSHGGASVKMNSFLGYCAS
jgi:hypothetical protein